MLSFNSLGPQEYRESSIQATTKLSFNHLYKGCIIDEVETQYSVSCAFQNETELLIWNYAATNREIPNFGDNLIKICLDEFPSQYLLKIIYFANIGRSR